MFKSLHCTLAVLFLPFILVFAICTATDFRASRSCDNLPTCWELLPCDTFSNLSYARRSKIPAYLLPAIQFSKWLKALIPENFSLVFGSETLRSMLHYAANDQTHWERLTDRFKFDSSTLSVIQLYLKKRRNRCEIFDLQDNLIDAETISSLKNCQNGSSVQSRGTAPVISTDLSDSLVKSESTISNCLDDEGATNNSGNHITSGGSSNGSTKLCQQPDENTWPSCKQGIRGLGAKIDKKAELRTILSNSKNRIESPFIIDRYFSYDSRTILPDRTEIKNRSHCSAFALSRAKCIMSSRNHLISKNTEGKIVAMTKEFFQILGHVFLRQMYCNFALPPTFLANVWRKAAQNSPLHIIAKEAFDRVVGTSIPEHLLVDTVLAINHESYLL